KQNNDQTDRHHHHQSCLLILQLVIFTGPFHAIPIGKAYLLGETSLSLIDGALKVPIPHTELDRNITLVILAIDDECARLGRDGSHLLQGNARPIGGADQDVTNCVNILSKFWKKPDHEIEQPFSFIDLGHRLTSDGGLHHGIHIRHLESIACDRLTIDLDQQIRLPHETEYPQVPYAVDLPHDPLDLGRQQFHGFQIGSEHFDRVLTLH